MDTTADRMSLETAGASTINEVAGVSTINEVAAVSSINEVELSIPIVSTNNTHINDIIWKKISNFHDVSWLFRSTSMLKETQGDAFGVGATRTYVSGGKETVLKRDDEKMFLQWDLDTYDDYKGSLEINEGEIIFKVQGKVRKEQLLIAKRVMESRLSTLVADSLITDDDKLIIDQNVACLDYWTRKILNFIPKMVL